MARSLLAFTCLFFLLPALSLFAHPAGGDGAGTPFPGQSTAFPFEKRFAFSAYPDEQGRTVNFFLQKIAEGTGRLRVYTAYAFEGEVHARVMPVNNGHELALLMGRSGLSGDLVYRDFSLGKVLVPDLASFRIQVVDSAGDVVFQETVMDIGVPAEGETVYRRFLTSGQLPAGSQVVLKYMDFYYSDAVHGRFEDWVRVLESYYTAAGELQGIPDMLGGLSTIDPERVILDEFRLCEAEQVIARARYAPFHDWFGQEENDPAGVFHMLGDYGRQTALLRQEFNRAISSLDTLFYQKAMAVMGEGMPARGRELLLSALVYNPFHLGSHHALATMDHEAGDQIVAVGRLGRVISVMYPSGMWKDSLHVLAGQVTEAIFETGMEYIEDGRFLDALRVLESVQEFCHVVTGHYPCPPRLQELQSIAHQGMFRSFITVSERALANDNLAFCVQYIRSALDYQREHPGFVPSVRDAALLLQRVVARHIEKGATLWLEGNLEAAGRHYREAEQLCEEFDFPECRGIPAQP